MPQKTFKFELRVNFEGTELEIAEKNIIVEQTTRMAAKHAYTTALLLADESRSRKPECVLSSGDMFEGTKQISLADDIETEDEIKARIQQSRITSEVTDEI
jgi:hypothetical protein